MTSFRILIIALFYALIANRACQRLNDGYCETASYHNCNFDDIPGDASVNCHSDSDCVNAAGKACDTSSGACVQCTANNVRACSGTTPACGTKNTCAPCSDHTQCTS